MAPVSSRYLVYCALISCCLTAFPLPSQAEEYLWDSNAQELGAQDGAGSWNTSSLLWLYQGNNVAWQNVQAAPHSAIIGNNTSAAGVITLQENLWLQNLTFNAASSGTYAISYSSGRQIQWADTSVITSNANASLNANLISSGTLIKRGDQTLTISGSGSNGLTGTTQIEAGTLAMAKNTGFHALSGQVQVLTGGTLLWSGSHQLEDSTDLTIQGGSINFNNTSDTFRNYTQTSGGQTGGASGNLVITGTMLLSGGTGITLNSGGSMQVGAADFTGMASNIITILLGGANTNVVTSFQIGSGGLTMSGQQIRLNVTANSTQKGNRMSLNGNFTANGSNIIQTEDIAPSNPDGVSDFHLGDQHRIFSIQSGTTQFLRHLTMTGTQGFSKQGTGTLIFNTTANRDNINVKTIQLSEGTLRLAASEQLANDTQVTISGGKFEANGPNETLKGVQLSGGELNVVANGYLNLTHELQATSGSNVTVSSGATLRSQSMKLQQATVILGSNYSPTITRLHLQGGNLELNQQTITYYRPTLAGAGGNEFLQEGNVIATGTSSAVLDSQGSLTDGSIAQWRIQGTNREIEVSSASDLLTIGVVLAGEGSWSKTGAGTLTLNGQLHNTYQGITKVQNGTLNLAKSANVDAIAANLEIQGGTVNLNGNQQIHNNASVDLSSGVFNVAGRNETFLNLTKTGGDLRSTSGVIEILGTFRAMGGTSNNMAGTIYTINSGGHTKVHTLDYSESTRRSALLIGGNSANLTQMTIGEGGLKIRNNDLVLNRENGGSQISLNGTVEAYETNQFSLGGLGASGNRVGQIHHGTQSITWNIVTGTTSSAIPITSSGGGLVKTGAGTLALTAQNNYSGKTTISQGTIDLGSTGNLSQTPWIEVDLNATLQVNGLNGGFSLNQSPNSVLSGRGTLLGNLTLGQGASLRPGMSGLSENPNFAGIQSGQLSITGNLNATQSSSSLVAILNIASSMEADKISISGNLQLNQLSQIQVTFDESFTNYQAGNAWTLIDWAGSLNATGFSTGISGRSGENSAMNEGNLDLPTLGAGLNWQIDPLELSKSLRISIVPEPSRALLALAGMIVMVQRRRRS